MAKLKSTSIYGDLFVSGEINNPGGFRIGANQVINTSGNVYFDGIPTTVDQSRGIFWTAYDKETTGDLSDVAHIMHTVNSGGLAGSVLEISAQNDATDGVNFVVNSTTSGVRINGHAIYNSGNANLSTVDWNAQNFTASGTITGAGDVQSGTAGALVCRQTAGTDTTTGISLYGDSGTAHTYGIQFLHTANSGYGTYGSVSSDWAMYFNMNNTGTRGWIFRADGVGGVASISVGGNATFKGTVTCANINTGQGTTEVYNMNQNVRTTDAVTFAGVSTGTLTVSGTTTSTGDTATNTYFRSTDNAVVLGTASSGTLYLRPYAYNSSTGQSTFTTSLATIGTNTTINGSLTCTNINTGQGTTEVYNMNQNVRTTDAVTFSAVASNTYFRSTNNIATLGTGTSGTVYLRPTAYNISTAQSTFTTSLATIGTNTTINGSLTTNQSIDAPSAKFTSVGATAAAAPLGIDSTGVLTTSVSAQKLVGIIITAKGSYYIGDVATDTAHTISIPTQQTSSYVVLGNLRTNSSDWNSNNDVTFIIYAKTTTSFGIAIREISGATQSLYFDYVIVY